MGFGDFYSGDKKKPKKKDQEKKSFAPTPSYVPPHVEIIGKGKKDK